MTENQSRGYFQPQEGVRPEDSWVRGDKKEAGSELDRLKAEKAALDAKVAELRKQWNNTKVLLESAQHILPELAHADLIAAVARAESNYQDAQKKQAELDNEIKRVAINQEAREKLAKVLETAKETRLSSDELKSNLTFFYDESSVNLMDTALRTELAKALRDRAGGAPKEAQTLLDLQARKAKIIEDDKNRFKGDGPAHTPTDTLVKLDGEINELKTFMKDRTKIKIEDAELITNLAKLEAEATKNVTGSGVEPINVQADVEPVVQKVETNDENPDLLDFNEKLLAIDVLADEVRTQMAGTDAAALEAAIKQLDAVHGEAGDATLLLVGTELADATARLEAMKVSDLVVEARAKLAELKTTPAPTDQVGNPADGGADADAVDEDPKKDPKADTDKPPVVEKKSRFPKWPGFKKAFRKVMGLLTSRDEDVDPEEAKKIEAAESKKKMDEILDDAADVLKAINLNISEDLIRSYDFRHFNKIDANVEAWNKMIDEDTAMADADKQALKARIDNIKALYETKKKKLTELNIKFV